MGDVRARPDETLDAPGPDWQRLIAGTLAARGVTVAAYVPDTRLQGILRALAGHRVRMRSLTREEECVGYAAGQRVAGGRPVVLMQSSGLGNAINALGSLVVPYRLGIPLVISMRGTLGEANPSQIPMGRATAPLLGALGIQAFSLRSATAVRQAADGALTLAYDAGECVALLLEAELGGGRETS
jgi:sulfopyruvate decarboxylase alpha subunit